LFVQAAVEKLPREFDGIASELSVQFPWGSLLQGVIRGEQQVLENLRRLCSPTASLRIIFGIDKDRDQVELHRLSLPYVSVEYLEGVLANLYSGVGFEGFHSRLLAPEESAQLNTTWARRLRNSNKRQVYEITARVEP
jgi:16S rRNA (adenine(1408)-N(1))-methyltransferase